MHTVWVGLSLLQEEPLKEVGSQHAGCGLVLSSLFRGSQNWEGCRDLPTSDVTRCTYGWWVRKEGQTVRKSLLSVCTCVSLSLFLWKDALGERGQLRSYQKFSPEGGGGREGVQQHREASLY